MTVSDHILKFLKSKGVSHVFGITGGAIAFTIDAFTRTKGIKFIPVAHEQAAAMMAESYARHKGLGCAMATSGPGATNLITGIACAYFDSIPVIYITGNVNPEEMAKDGVRQVGFQETDIVNMVKPITKWSYQLPAPYRLRRALEKAYHKATEGRMGPVLIDLPMNMQKENV